MGVNISPLQFMAKEIAKQVSLSSEMWTQTQMRVEQLGIDFPEYVRHLILKDTECLRDNLYYMSDDLAERVQKAREEIARGDSIVLKTPDDLKKYKEKLEK